MNGRNILTAVVGLAFAEMALGQVGLVTTVIGSKLAGYGGDNNPVVTGGVGPIVAMTVDGNGNVYFASDLNQIFKVAPGSGLGKIVAGVPCSISEVQPACYGGDGGPATDAQMSVASLAVDGNGNLYLAEAHNSRIRKVDIVTGVISTIAGNGSPGYYGDGGPATRSNVTLPRSVALDSAGNVYFADSGNGRVRRIDAATGIITTFAGTGSSDFFGDGGPATNAGVAVSGVAVDGSDNLFLSDTGTHRIRKIDARTGIITTVVGNGCTSLAPDGQSKMGCFAGDGGPATSASLNKPSAIAVDGSGNLYIADTDNERIREVDSQTGVITTVAGDGCTRPFDYPDPVGCYSGGNGGPATSASLSSPTGVAADARGNVYIGDYSNARILELSFTTNPGITSLSPASGAPGNAAFTLTVSGVNFLCGSTVNWNGSPLPTSFVSATQLTASVPANLVASAGTANITVTSPGSITSGAVPFNIYTPAVPVITGLSESPDPTGFLASGIGD